MNEDSIEKERQKLKDFEILKKIVEGKEEISNLDYETKKRLIKICSIRLDEMNKKIEDTQNEIEKLEKMIYNTKK